MKEELEYLDYTLKKLDEEIDDSKLKIKNIKELYKFDYEAMLEEKDKLEKEIVSLTKAKLKPYFARIDFQSKTNFDKCYIGKKGVTDCDNNVITVDWRSPIASVYYDANIGDCEYSSPSGIIKGNLLLKRQYTIENGNLIDYNDVDTVSNDELLKPYLSVSADNRLKNIVSTIQSEQNKIIREKMNKNLVIQGVAGSGKTTVALHRIAYLVYNNRNLFKPSDYMVIGPNRFFVSYISSILPDLDVNGVIQNTFNELFLNYVPERFTINNSLDILKEKDEIASLKLSMNMKNYIDNYFNQLKIIPNDDLVVNGIKLLNKSFINDLYNDLNEKIYVSVKSKIDRIILLSSKYLNDNIDNISNKMINSNVSQKEIINIKSNINLYLKKHFKVLDKKIKDIYVDILNNLNIDTINIRKNIIDVEDIPSLMYIKYKMFGSSEFDNYRHIVIDEAQDYGKFAFFVINKIFKNSTFSIYGDLAQSLYPYRSIDNWECLEEIFDNFEILKLNKSYRTTIEIMNEANKINDLLKLDRAIPVIRHGEEVEYFDGNILNIINRIKDKYKTIAIITKEQNEANIIYEELKKYIDISLINSSNFCYNGSVSVLPSYLSKGLEFDAVIINGENSFNVDNVLDMKLLYVSKTRALHKLFIEKI